MPNTLDELRALERRIKGEWWWLNGALHAVAQVRMARQSGRERRGNQDEKRQP
jgi:hypothetical protein